MLEEFEAKNRLTNRYFALVSLCRECEAESAQKVVVRLSTGSAARPRATPGETRNPLLDALSRGRDLTWQSPCLVSQGNRPSKPWCLSEVPTPNHAAPPIAPGKYHGIAWSGHPAPGNIASPPVAKYPWFPKREQHDLDRHTTSPVYAVEHDMPDPEHRRQRLYGIAYPALLGPGEPGESLEPAARPRPRSRQGIK